MEPGLPRLPRAAADVVTGTSVTTPIAGGQPGGLTGKVTDDGTLLAVQSTDGQLSVYDTSSRQLTVIPGTALNNNYWQNFGWLNSSHTLVVAAPAGATPRARIRSPTGSQATAGSGSPPEPTNA